MLHRLQKVERRCTMDRGTPQGSTLRDNSLRGDGSHLHGENRVRHLRHHDVHIPPHLSVEDVGVKALSALDVEGEKIRSSGVGTKTGEAEIEIVAVVTHRRTFDDGLGVTLAFIVRARELLAKLRRDHI